MGKRKRKKGGKKRSRKEKLTMGGAEGALPLAVAG